jgi:hypothetical protein
MLLGACCRGFGHAQGIFQVAVFQEDGVAQLIGLVIERQFRRRPVCCGPKRRVARRPFVIPENLLRQQLCRRVRCPLCRPFCRVELFQQGELQQHLGVALGHLRAACGTRNIDQLAQHGGICGVRRQLFLCQRQCLCRVVARLQDGHSTLQIDLFLRLGIGAGLAGLQIPAGCHVIQAVAECGLGGNFQHLWGIVGGCALEQDVKAAPGQIGVLHGQGSLPGVKQLGFVQRTERQQLLFAHGIQALRFALRCLGRCLLELEVAGFPVFPRILLRLLQRCGWRGLDCQLLLAFLFFDALQQGLQLRIVRFAAQEIAQIGLRQFNVSVGGLQPLLQVIAGIEDPQGAAHQPCQQQDQPDGRDFGSLNGGRIALG